MRNTALIRDVKTDESKGRLSGQRNATERRPLSETRDSPILQKVIGLCYRGHLRAKSVASTLQGMRRTLAIVTVFLAMFWVASPALACLLPGPAMTATERACCEQMAKMCGAEHMLQSHSCCQQVAQPSNTSIFVAHYQLAPALRVIAALSPLSMSRDFALAGATLDHPPSDSPPGSSVLRI
jgi:hypothetical protein